MTNPVVIAKAPRLTDEKIVPLTVKEATAVLTTSSTRRNGARFGVPNALIRTLRAHRQTHGIGNLVSVGDGHPPTQPTTDSP